MHAIPGRIGPIVERSARRNRAPHDCALLRGRLGAIALRTIAPYGILAQYGACRIIVAFVAGGCWFFTVNLFDRNSRLLVEHIDTLREAVRDTQRRFPFHIDAMVILPDHLHAVWTLPDGDCDFPVRWRLIKVGFSKSIPRREWRTKVRQARGERGIWQRRYWEHLIRNERDYAHHIDYCWFNPVKHGLVKHVEDWRYSSFHRENRGNPRPGDFRDFEKALTERARSAGYGERP